MAKNILKGTTTYLAGPIQYKSGRQWRDLMSEELTKMGIRVFNPYNHPFVDSLQEVDLAQNKFKDLAAEGKFDELAKHMFQIRKEDLECCNLSNFVIVYIDTTVHTAGTYEELFYSAKLLEKPVFLICEQGKANVPFWLFGTLDHKYFYNNANEVLEVIKNINSGKKKIDNHRWSILRPEFLK